MAVIEDELKPDTVPDFSPIKEEGTSLFEKMKARRKGPEPRAPKEARDPATAPPRARKAVTGKGKTNHEKRANKVTKLVTTAGMGVGAVGMFRPHTHLEVIDGVRTKVPDDLYARDAKAVFEGAALVGETWASWADENEQIAKAIDSLSAGGAMAAAILSLLAIIVPVAANHGVFPSMLAQQFTPAAIQKMLDDAKAEAETETEE